MRLSKITTFAAAASVMLLAAPALAQHAGSEIRIDQWQPAPAGSPFTRAIGPHERFEEGVAYAFRLDTEYQNAPVRTFVNDQDDDELFPVEHALLFYAGASLTPLYWLNLELMFPFAVFESGDEDTRVPSLALSAGEAGPGDLRAGVHFRPYSTPELDFSLGLRFWAPTGTSNAYLNQQQGRFRLEVVPALAGEEGIAYWGCTAGLSPFFFAGRDGDRLALSCAIQARPVPEFGVAFEPHFAAFSFPDLVTTAAPGQAAETQSSFAPGLDAGRVAVTFEPAASLYVNINGFTIGLSGGPGLGNAPGSPSGRAVLTLGYAARGEHIVEEGVEDRDFDGVADEYDACPDAAGPKSRRGCPDEQDIDGDGFIDDDACPDEAGARYDDPDANGCPDKDNDHIADPVDPCPNEPGESSGGCPRFARLDGGNFVIDPPIAFVRARSTLSDDAKDSLIEILRTMRVNPKIKQISIKLGSQRTPAFLTDKRAAAILQVLETQQVDSSRYEVVLDEDLQGGNVEVHVIR